VPEQLRTRDIAGKLILLGTGTSVGVPAVGCGCDTCTSDDPKNQRTRSSAIFGLPGGNLLIDTTPDLRTQLLREGIGVAHAVAYTHDHADHIFGLDDLRLFPFYLGHPVPLYCEPYVEERIRRAFDYAFGEPKNQHPGATPQIAMNTIGVEPFAVLDSLVVPIRLQHGPNFQSLGFRVGDAAYCTDTNGIPPESIERLQGLDVLILDGLRWRPHSTHFCIEEAIEVARQLKPKATYFTHLSHDVEHRSGSAKLPTGMHLAYDGLTVPLE